MADKNSPSYSKSELLNVPSFFCGYKDFFSYKKWFWKVFLIIIFSLKMYTGKVTVRKRFRSRIHIGSKFWIQIRVQILSIWNHNNSLKQHGKRNFELGNPFNYDDP